MKPRPANHKTAALTLTEVLLVIAALALLAAILLPALAAAKRKSSKIGCVSNLKQVGISYRMWTDDNFGKYPMQVSATNDGAMESIATGNVAACFSVLSNTLDNPAILICPLAAKHFSATNFGILDNSNISYFVGLDALSTQPRAVLSGDDNFIVNGAKVRSGVLSLHPGDSLGWSRDRHPGAGNILLVDDSVQQVSSAGLNSFGGLATNRLAIP
jgi:competence protein ComGC